MKNHYRILALLMSCVLACTTPMSVLSSEAAPDGETSMAAEAEVLEPEAPAEEEPAEVAEVAEVADEIEETEEITEEIFDETSNDIDTQDYSAGETEDVHATEEGPEDTAEQAVEEIADPEPSQDQVEGAIEENREEAAVAATDGNCGKDLTWEYRDGVLTIKGTGEMYDYDEEHQPEWLVYAKEIEELRVEKGITLMDGDAFLCLTELETIRYEGSEEAWEELENAILKDKKEVFASVTEYFFGEENPESAQDPEVLEEEAGTEQPKMSTKAAVESLKITEQPEDVTAFAGDTVSFHIGTNSAEVTYRWQWSSNGITWTNSTAAGSDEATFNFPMKETYDGILVRCVVTGVAGTLISETAVMTLKRFEITKQPESVTARAGETVSLHVETNRADTSYQWQSSRYGYMWRNVTSEGSDTDTFSFEMDETYDGVRYRCIVTCGAGTLTSEAATVYCEGEEFEITRQPEDVAAFAGDTVNLHVEANRTDASYKWQWSSDGTTWTDLTLEGSDTDTLSFDMDETYDGILVRCVVTCEAGTLISETAVMTLEMFEITKQPENVTARAGETVNLHVETNRADASYQWQSSRYGYMWRNVTSEGSDTDTLSFEMDETYDGVRYRCIVTCGAGTLTSEAATVYCEGEEFEITKQPEDVTALAGETVSLHVETNRADTSYQWQWSSNGITWTNSSASGSNEATFNFLMKETYDGILVRCVVTCGAGTLISEAAVMTLEKFEITKQPESVTARAGETVSLHVETNRADTSYQWQWSRNGYMWRNLTSEGGDTDTLSFTMDETLNGRQYRCVVTSGSEQKTSAAVTVTCFRITEQPEDVTVLAGETVSLHVGTNSAEVTYRWQWSSNGTTWTDCTTAGSDTDTLSFTMNETLDGRQYRCVVTGGAGTLTSEAATVYCEGEDFRITEQPEDVTALAGETVSLHVGTNRADAAYKWQWSSNGTTWTDCTTAGSDTDTLSFTMDETLDGRQYRCIVTCGAGMLTSGAATVTCFMITEQPEDVTARAGDTVSLHVGTNSEDAVYKWQWSSDGTTWTDCTTAGSDTDTFSFTMDETLDGRQYRCIVTGGAGTLTSETATVYFEEEFEITAQPEDVTALAGETVSLHVETNRADTSYQWQWSRYGYTWTDITSAGSDTDTLSFTMNETLDGRQYRCVVTSGSEQKISEAATVTCFMITEQPEDVTALAGDTVSLHVETNSTEVTYRWQWSNNGTTWRSITSTGSNTDTFSFTMSETLDGRQYHCVVTGRAGTLISDAATVTCFRITEQPEDVTARVGDTVSLHVGTNRADTTYQWQSSRNGNTWWNITSVGSDTDTLSFDMDETLDGRQYRCVVTSGNEQKTSDAATVTCFRIAEHPEDVTALAGDTVSLHVGTNSAEVTYRWQWSSNGTTWTDCTTAGSDTDTLSFTMDETLDGRQCRCVVTGVAGMLISDVATVTCFRITEQPEDVTALAGDTVSLHVGTNSAEVTYRWQWSNNGTTWRSITSTGSNTDTFSFTMNETLDGRQYRCVVTGGAGTLISDAATVTCFRITEQPEDVTARAGDTVSLHVGTNSADAAYKWQSSRNGNTWWNITSAGSDTDTLSFTMDETLDGRQYRCVVTSGSEQKTSEAVTVTCFRITEQPESMTALAGDTVSLHVGTNVAEVTYRWQWSSNGTAWTDCTTAGSDTDMFSFTMQEAYDGIQLRCVVTGVAGTLTSEVATVYCEEENFEITKQPENVTALTGETVSLHVETNRADTAYQWQWSRSGYMWRNLTSAGSDTDTLSFEMNETLDGTRYRCIVTFGEEQKTSQAATVTCFRITEQPEDVAARAGDIVSFHVGTNSAEVTYRWQWSSNGTTWTDITSAGSDTDTLSFTMRETYNGRQYRCIVTGGAGILTSEAAVLTITSQIVIDGVVYEMIDNEMTVTGYIGSADTVVVRETVDGHTVTVIGESAFEGSSIRSIDLPDTIEVIRKRAFANCSNLTSMY